jgi:hypothetical protein
VLSKNVTNELRGGLTAFYGASNFGYASNLASRNGPASFADQGGFAITTPTNTTDWYTSNSPSWRSAPTYSVDEMLTWLKDSHTFTFAGNVLISNAESDGQQMVPGITLGFNTDFDPAIGLFNTTNFPGASSAQLDAARATYAVLTGRVASINSQAVLDGNTNKYVELGPTILPGGIRVYGTSAQDTWRLRPNVTLTGGVRWEVQTPFTPFNSTMSSVTMTSACGQSGLGAGGLYSKCNFLQPGSLVSAAPQFIQLKKGTEGYKTDWNNVAPSASIAWRPDVKFGFLRTMLGDPEQATLRAGYSEAYERQGLTVFTSLYGANTGNSISLSRNANLGLVPPGQSWPVLLSQTDRLASASFTPDPSFPIAIRANRADSLNAFAPDIKIARVRNWMVGFARSLSKDTAMEIRYVGNKGDNEWSSINYNCLASNSSGCTSIRSENLVANGFMKEFQLAMTNLAANNASGIANRAGSFAYFGPNTGTSPLPIYLAYLNGSGDFGNPAAYVNPSTSWANATIAGRLVAPNPNPNAAASDLDSNLTRRNNAAKLGYAGNFFIVNPDVGNDNVTDSGAFSNYHALQFEVRRRLANGFSANVNYQYVMKMGTSAFDGFSFGRGWALQTENNIRHAVKMNWDWTLPVGRGKRFGTDMHGVLNSILGGWSINGVGRLQTQLVDFGNVRLVGMSKSEFQSMYKYRFVDNPSTGIREVWMLPDDVILNTRRAFSTSNTTLNGYSTSLGAPTGRYLAPANSADCIQMRPGDCAPRNLTLLAPWFRRFDMGATKRIGMPGTGYLELRFDVLNVFNTPNFVPVTQPTSSQGGYTSASLSRVTAAYTDPSNTYDPGGRIGQLMVRFSW